MVKAVHIKNSVHLCVHTHLTTGGKITETMGLNVDAAVLTAKVQRHLLSYKFEGYNFDSGRETSNIKVFTTNVCNVPVTDRTAFTHKMSHINQSRNPVLHIFLSTLQDKVPWRPDFTRTQHPDDAKTVGHQTCRKQTLGGEQNMKS